MIGTSGAVTMTDELGRSTPRLGVGRITVPLVESLTGMLKIGTNWGDCSGDGGGAAVASPNVKTVSSLFPGDWRTA